MADPGWEREQGKRPVGRHDADTRCPGDMKKGDIGYVESERKHRVAEQRHVSQIDRVEDRGL